MKEHFGYVTLHDNLERHPDKYTGRKRHNAGNNKIDATRKTSIAKNGMTPPKIVDIGVSGANDLMTNTLRPTGGVMSPNSTTTSANMPNQIFNCSDVIPNAASAAAT